MSTALSTMMRGSRSAAAPPKLAAKLAAKPTQRLAGIRLWPKRQETRDKRKPAQTSSSLSQNRGGGCKLSVRIDQSLTGTSRLGLPTTRAGGRQTVWPTHEMNGWTSSGRMHRGKNGLTQKEIQLREVIAGHCKTGVCRRCKAAALIGCPYMSSADPRLAARWLGYVVACRRLQVAGCRALSRKYRTVQVHAEPGTAPGQGKATTNLLAGGTNEAGDGLPAA